MIDHRHKRRIKLLQDLFACTFNQFNIDKCLEEKSSNTIVYRIIKSLEEIDAEIQSVAPERPLGEINKVDLAIIRLIVFESKQKKTPKKVLLNEAIELAKSFSSEKSPGFVNGVLGKIIMHSEKKNE
jgi:transcription antitermination protein NusB